MRDHHGPEPSATDETTRPGSPTAQAPSSLIARLKALRWRLLFHPWTIGSVDKLTRLTGNHIRCRGLKFSVRNPMVSRLDKAALLYGLYERAELELSMENIDVSLPTVELGGSIGVVACVTNRRLARPTEHVVVEPNPRLAPTLEENRGLNGCRFEIVNAALGYGSPTIDFFVEEALTGSTRESGGQKYTVSTTSLGRIIEDRGFGRINLIVDIEGAEIGMVENELETLRRHVKHIIMETHDRFLPPGETSRMIDRLEGAGFRIAAESGAGEHVLALVNRDLVAEPAAAASP